MKLGKCTKHCYVPQRLTFQVYSIPVLRPKYQPVIFTEGFGIPPESSEEQLLSKPFPMHFY
jgi:hypothetical protein